MRIWSVEEVAYTGHYYQVMITVYGRGFKAALSKSKNSHNGLRANVAVKQT